MFKKENRLTKKKDFDNIFKKGRSVFNKVLGLKVIINDLDINRFGVIVSNKISKRAIERNKIKRRIREVLKKEEPVLKKGYDIVVIALAETKQKEYQDLEQILKEKLSKLALYKG
ncbi:ribonuclease P protein component [bacterium]|nr:ribonuclease P protein component [bacterium]